VRNLDRYSGAAYQALNLAKQQTISGLDVAILNVSEGNSHCVIFDHDFKIYDSKTRGYFLLLTKLFIKYDLIHFHGMFLREIIFAKFFGCKILLKSTLLGEDDFKSLESRPYGKVRIALIKWAVDVNNALSTPMEIVNASYLPKSKIKVIPNFVANNGHVSTILKENLVVYVGAIVSRKRVLDAIDFFEKHIESSGCKMLVIGPCDIIENQSDIDYIARFKERIASNDNIDYIGKVRQSDVLSIFAKSKALIFLSDKEGMPNVVLEALAANCFVITSSISGVASDIYKHGVEGFNIDIEDVFEYQCMEYSISNNLPLKLAEEKFYFSKNAQIYEKVYKEMLID
jgi:glycosyltransferase involved in cell wall biosynthesis